MGAAPSRDRWPPRALVSRLITLGVVLDAAFLGTGPDFVQAQCQYEVTSILGPPCPPPFPGTATLSGKGINELGEVVGEYAHCGGDSLPDAFRWSPESGLELIDFPAGTSSSTPTDINDLGQVVGWYNPPSEFGALAFFWDQEGLVTIFPPPGGSWSAAHGINNAGQVVGEAVNPATNSGESFPWGNGTMVFLGPFEILSSSAHDINENGAVTGYVGSTSFLQPTARGYFWEDGNLTVLEPIPGGVTSVALGINNTGEVVGWGLVPSRKAPSGFVNHPFLLSSGQMIDLGTLPGYCRCSALDINDLGQVVGGCDDFCDFQLPPGPFFWQNGVMTDVNDLLPPNEVVTINFVRAINNQGQIVGTGLITSAPNSWRAVVLTPMNVPAADLNKDCVVNAFDLGQLLGAWGVCSPGTDCSADLTGDGAVNAYDLAILLGAWS